ncbi:MULTISPECIES: ribonuclease P protein component [Deefgea]|uniref:Ribonuclease P protein component n=2 Tax=Deefgea TaxID=400947 RepID=A0A6M8SMS7_9NEIS|nr:MULTISPECIES: ribonuclease P protein component [Deefgea]MBM5574566.1 ribonuclease P protein component [Deefgea sp. CFH1-16]MCB5196874.1 ribonuclease P protein component [Deefgea salmonis]QKJ66522.1 ribonuclease P protein component [Deefgea piscis]QZA81688.1 ribonuclease P protein component [Deefgea piscis]
MQSEKRYRFARDARLLKTDDFSSVFSLRASVSNDYFQVLGKPNLSQHARLGLVVGKKTDKRAVGRNYIKRTVRELFRQNTELLLGLDVVVRSRKPFARQDGAAARAALLSLFKRIKQCRALSSRC